MNRSPLVILLVAAVAAVPLVFLHSELFAAPSESVELPVPDISQSVITPNVPTFVTVSVGLPDTAVSSPKLQYLNSGKWKPISPLKDNGKDPDSLKGDRNFAVRLRLLDQSGTVELAIVPKTGKEVVKASSTLPLQLRLSAVRKGQSGQVISPSFTVIASSPTPVSFSSPPITLSIPPSAGAIDTEDPSVITVRKTGPDGYLFDISSRPNPNSWPLESWVLSCFYGPCTALPAPGDPQTLAAYRPDDIVQPTVLAGLSGIRLDSVDDSGNSILFFLDDPSNQRVIVIQIVPQTPDQALHLTDNMPELMAILNSIHL